MRIGIIGAGRLGTTMGKYLQEAGENIVGFYSKTGSHAREAATFVKTAYFSKLEDLVGASDTLFIATPDSVIGEVWGCIANYPLQGKLICHFSGSLSSEIFLNVRDTGASGCSIHPMFAFNDPFHSYKQFHTACLVLEGQAPAKNAMEALFQRLGHKVLTIDGADKGKYHAAAAMASNDMIALFQSVLDLLQDCGFSREDSQVLLEPLIRNNVDAMLEKGPKKALTGPVDRGDIQTVRKHREALENTKAGEIYKALGTVLVEIVKEKYPERDHSAMEEIFNCENK